MISKSQNTSSTAATKNLELPDELQKIGFCEVTVPVNSHTKNMIIIHNSRPAIAILDSLNWSNTEKSVKIALSNNGIDKQSIEKFMVFLTQEYVKVMKENLAVNTAKEEDNENIHYMQKYSDDTILAEAVLIAGVPMFIVSELQANETKITITDCIDLEYKVIKPLKEFAYLNRPYSFASSDQINKLIERAKLESLATLYRKVKAICYKCIKEDHNHIHLLAADIIFTHFQDILGVTHYLFFVGGPDSGKSSNLSFIEILAYRNFLSIDITPANVYRFLGKYEEGQGTLSFDEANAIADNDPLMSIFKSGYTKGKKVPRVDVDREEQNAYCTYGFKAYAGEELSDSRKAIAFNTRCIPLKCTPGVPELDITEILNPAGDDEDQKELVELMDLRNLLLAFRLLHFHDSFPNINNLDLKGREKQLFKPLLRLFQRTEISKEIEDVVSYYVSKRREVNKSTLPAFLYQCIRQIIKIQTEKLGGPANANVIESDTIWDYIKSNLPGNEISIRPQSFQSVDYGEISQKGIAQILKEVFGATPAKRHGQGRKLVFDLNKLDRFESLYGIEKVEDGDTNSGTNNGFFGSEQDDNEDSSQSGTDGTHGTHSDEKAYHREESMTQKNVDIEPANRNNSEESQINDENYTLRNDQKSYEHSNNVSQVSQASQLVEAQGSTTTSGPPIDQNFQNRIPAPKEATFSSKNYEKSSSCNILLRKSPEGVIPVKETIIEGIPPIPCIFCNNFRTPIEFDLGMHLYDNHRMELVKLPIGKGDMEYRIEYAVEECKKRIVLIHDG